MEPVGRSPGRQFGRRQPVVRSGYFGSRRWNVYSPALHLSTVRGAVSRQARVNREWSCLHR
jgi:hypothetical protein